LPFLHSWLLLGCRQARRGESPARSGATPALRINIAALRVAPMTILASSAAFPARAGIVVPTVAAAGWISTTSRRITSSVAKVTDPNLPRNLFFV
jgi:hypothetical protein